MRGWQDYAHRARRTGAPATVGIIVLLILSFLFAWLFVPRGGTLALALGPDLLSRPWSLLTFPFADTGDGRGLIWFLFLLYWFWWVGSSMEFDNGSKKLVGFWLAMTVLFAASLWIGMMLLNARVDVFGAGLPVAALTVAWGTRNQNQFIRLMFLIPIQGKWLAILATVLVFFGYGTGAPLMGVFAIAPLALAHLYAANRLPIPYGRSYSPSRPTKVQQQRDQKYFDDVKRREQERAERERLRKLFEGSMKDDDKE
jgi:hypothetical protein